MKRYDVLIVLILILITNQGVMAQVGDAFPKMSVKTLNGRNTNLPDTILGKKSLLILSFSPKSEKYMEAWLTPIFNLFIGQKNNPLDISDEENQPNLVFVPMVTGIYQIVDDKVYQKLKSSINEEFYQYVLFYSGPLKPYKDTLKFGAKDVPYLYVLDKDGKILHLTFGEYSKAKMDEILRFIE
jgi:hypothetical protein